MAFKVDLVDKLREAEEGILAESKEILALEYYAEKEIENRLGQLADQGPELPELNMKHESVFSIDSIKKICRSYRLRFLPSHLFTGEIPQEAVFKIKELEKKYNTAFSEFSIIAPAERFRLKDSEKDPILLAHLGEDKFLFVHKWGEDMSFARRILNFPFAGFRELLMTGFVLSFFVTLVFPSSLLYSAGATAGRIYLSHMYLFFLLSMFFTIGTFIAGVWTRQDLSSDVWNDESFN